MAPRRRAQDQSAHYEGLKAFLQPGLRRFLRGIVFCDVLGVHGLSPLQCMCLLSLTVEIQSQKSSSHDFLLTTHF